MYLNQIIFSILHKFLEATLNLKKVETFELMYPDYCSQEIINKFDRSVFTRFKQSGKLPTSVLVFYAKKFEDFLTSTSGINVFSDYDSDSEHCKKYIQLAEALFKASSQNIEILEEKILNVLRNTIINSQTLDKDDITYFSESAPALDYKPEESLCFFLSLVINIALRDEIKKRPHIIPKKSSNITKYQAPSPCVSFKGRDSELKKIHNIIDKNPHLYIYGEHGIGKSELIKAYVAIYKASYDHVIYINCSGNLYRDIANLKLTKYPTFEKNWKILNKLGNRLLLVIDNYNDPGNDPDTLYDIRRLDCKILFSSTYRYPDTVSIKIGPISQKDVLRSFFNPSYRKNEDDSACIDNLIKIYSGNTAAIRALADIANYYSISPSELCFYAEATHFPENQSDAYSYKFDENEFNGLRDIAIELIKDNQINRKSFMEYLFDPLSKIPLTPNQIRIVKNLLLMPARGINAHTLFQLTKYDKEDFLFLISKGIITNKGKSISMPGLVYNYYRQQLKVSITDCSTLLDNFCHELEIAPSKGDIINDLKIIAFNIIAYTEKNCLNTYKGFLEKLILCSAVFDKKFNSYVEFELSNQIAIDTVHSLPDSIIWAEKSDNYVASENSSQISENATGTIHSAPDETNTVDSAPDETNTVDSAPDETNTVDSASDESEGLLF